VRTASQVIAQIREVAPPGPNPAGADLHALRKLTLELAAASPGAVAEYERFAAIQQRSIGLAAMDLQPWLAGKKVLVTGGTGCIGSALMKQVSHFACRHLASVSRGITTGRPQVHYADYYVADIRDRRQLADVFAEVQPDVVFHVAAQRDPGLAELEVHRTVTTNVLGTRNVLEAAAEHGVPQVIAASTGKALRPYSPDIYTASKRAAEWLLSQAAGSARVSAARFTHVIDNSIIHGRLLNWCDTGETVRLHSPGIVFYVQSALESAQLLLAAGLGAREGSLMVHAITDLGWPVNLLDSALGLITVTGSQSPIWFPGYDQGYEEVPFPGLYDPLTAGDVSPLLNAFEADRAVEGRCTAVDAFPLEMAQSPWPAALLMALEETCERTDGPAEVRAALDALSWSLLDATLEAVPQRVLARSVKLCEPHRAGLNPEHARMLAAIERCTADEPALVPASGGQ
jgi:nucleoside-diphosphate-sugar epimerase